MQQFQRASMATLAVLLITVAALADEPVKLRYQMKQGDRVIYRTRTELKQNQAIGNMKFDAQMSSDSLATMSVDKVDADGSAHLHQQAERLKFVMKSGPAGEYKFDSEAKERDNASTLGKLLTPVFERMSGSAMDLTVTPLGEVKEVKGFAEQFADLLKDNPIAGQFLGGGTNEAAKHSFSEQFARFKEEPVKPGDTWEVPFDIELPKLGKLKGKRVYRYEGPDKVAGRATARITVTTDIAADIDSDLGEAKVSGSFTTADATGTIHFDPAAGKLVSIKSSLSLAGDMTVTAGGNTIPLRMEQTQTSSIDALDKLPEGDKP